VGSKVRVSDEQPGSDDTRTPGPLAGSDSGSWVPPRVQPPPFPRDQITGPGLTSDPHAYPTPGPTVGPYGVPPSAQQVAQQVAQQSAQQSAQRPPRGRVPGWLWPLVAVLALLLGVVGGVAGGAAYESWHLHQAEGQLTGGLAEAGTVTTPPLPVGNHSVAAVAQRLLPSTIQVLAAYHGAKDGATGSGFVLDRAGHYITNNHVVADAVSNGGPIEIVDQQGEKFTATVVGRSPTYDLAVLYVKGAPHLPPASLGTARVLRVGDQVVAFGSPLGLSSTVTSGIVSALNRPVTTSDAGSQASSYINAVQTDAAINPGNSGGPLVDLTGRVVGVNSAIATTGSSSIGQAGNIGVGFAIPIDQVRITADQILRSGKARYPVIGASVNTGATTDSGAKILAVKSSGPAARAGLRKGDIVTSIAGEPVADGIALIVAIRAHQPGETVRFTVHRGGSSMSLRITLGSQIG
jgi:putative serine protease PepD